jgi:hypothetical protein
MIRIKLAMAALALGSGAVASANVLVLRADGPTVRRHYPAGTRLPNNAVFELRVGDSLTILAGGGTRTFRGPGAFSMVRPATPYVLADGRQVRIDTGVVRAPTPEPGVDPTDPWEFDTRRSDSLCVRPGGAPLLWWPGSATAQRLTIRDAAGGSATASWAAGETHLAWPAALPIRDGAVYTLTREGSTRTTRITLRLLAAGTDADLASLSPALLASGCQGQLDTLIATSADPTATVAQNAVRAQNRR